ncbi:MAG TPA: ATP-binding protein, partial [Vicinamibacterales bacterium]|nr:ATP-binding protein [Vicinamibacterales bacterium]
MGVLIERETELTVLGEIVEAAAGGRGGAALIEGEPGIGKTQLLGLARDRVLTSEARVLYATADEIETGVPLAAARVLLGQAARSVARDGPARLGLLALDGALAESTGPGSRSDEVVHALWWLIVEVAEQRPLVLFLDDAQWADDLTLGLLRMVARRAPELSLALIVAARPSAPGGRHALLSAEPAFMRIVPSALSLAGTARLFEEVLGRSGSETVVAQAHAVTRGNPLYLSELLHQARVLGLDPMNDVFVNGRPPPQLVRMVEDRFKRLTPGASALARAVAVLGSDADA